MRGPLNIFVFLVVGDTASIDLIGYRLLFETKAKNQDYQTITFLVFTIQTYIWRLNQQSLIFYIYKLLIIFRYVPI